MDSSHSIIIWNCRGAAGKAFPALVKDLRRKFLFSMLVLLETKVSSKFADMVVKKLRFNKSFRVEAIDFAGGIWCLWNDDSWDVTVVSSSILFVHLELKMGDSSFLFIACYARPQVSF